MKKRIGIAEALTLTYEHILPLPPEILPLERLTGRVAATDVVSVVDSPSLDASLKDGYAVQAHDVQGATETHTVTLQLTGSVAAGAATALCVESGQAVRVTTGAPVPAGADAVLSEEFAHASGDTLLCHNTAGPGRNILRRGADMGRGQTVARRSDSLTPPLVGLLATAGIDRVPVYRSPEVCVMATGDEVVAPGKPLPEGQLYASNITEICAWLSLHRIRSRVCFAGDTEDDVLTAVAAHIDHVDAFISSGGIWGSERDLMLRALETRGWEGVYHRVRIGPGKAVAFGLLDDRPFFCLPGGPPSNEMAFLQIALPGVLRMRGHTGSPFPVLGATLTETVQGVSHWTQFIHAKLERGTDGSFSVTPLRQPSRLQSMAGKNALICIPEGCERLNESEMVDVQVLDSRLLHLEDSTP